MHLARDHRQLSPIRSGTAVVSRNDPSASLVKAENPPKDVRMGVAKLMLSFPMPGLSPADGQLLSGVYFQAVTDFAPAVVVWTLNWLLFHNPRNTPKYTCAPTPQDVREACSRTDSYWRQMVVEFYFGGARAKSLQNTTSQESAAIQGGKPGEPDCIVPFELQLRYLREDIERQSSEIAVADEQARRSFSGPSLLLIKEDAFDRIPHAAFPDGVLEMIRAKRAIKAEAARKAAERRAYLESLPDEVRAIRWTLVLSEEWRDKDEPEIIAEAHRRLDRVRVAEAEAALTAGDFAGLPCDGGTL